MRTGLWQCVANEWLMRARAWLRTATNSSIRPRRKAAYLGDIAPEGEQEMEFKKWPYPKAVTPLKEPLVRTKA